MKGSLACILEVLRALRDANAALPGKLIVVANSLHESPGGRGEDLYALTSQVPLKPEIVVVMEGATEDCTVAQLGSATFEIIIERNGEPCHQLQAEPGTPHPVTVASEVVRLLDQWNRELEQEWIDEIGYASFFVGSIHSGQFYNQLPKRAVLEGVRRYNPLHKYEDVELELKSRLNRLADLHSVEIHVDMRKVRDGYRIDKDSEAVSALRSAARKIRNIDLPPVGKKVVTDAGIFANAWGVPVLCHGPNQRTAHADVEYVEIIELETTVKVYLELIRNFMKIGGEESWQFI